MKKILSAVFYLLLISAVLFANGVADSQDKDTGSITYACGSWYEGYFDNFEKFNGYDLIERFEEQSGIDVNVEFYPYQELLQILEVRMQAKSDTLDVLSVDAPLTASYAARGYIKALDISKEDLEKEFFEAPVNMAMWNGKVYDIPFENSSCVMIINKKIFKDAGVEMPSADVNSRWTWEQVVDASVKIKEKTGGNKWGFAIASANQPYSMLPLPQSLGAGSGVSPDGMEVAGYLDNDGWKKALKWWNDVVNVKKIVPRGADSNEGPLLFAAGQVAMLITGTWDIPMAVSAKETSGLDFAVVPYPYFEGGTPVTPTNSWHLAISPYSKNATGAQSFIDYMTSSETMTDWVNGTGQLASHIAAKQAILTNEKYESFPYDAYRNIVLYEMENTAQTRPVTPFYLEWSDAVQKLFEDVSAGESVDKSLERAIDIIERAAERYK